MEINAAAIWINETFASFDLAVSTAVHKLYNLGGGFFTPFFEFVSDLAYHGIFLIILSILLMLFKKTRRFGTAVLLGLGVGLLLTNCVLKVLVARPRPFSDPSSPFYQMWLLVGQNIETDKSFPSGHTTAAFAASTAIYLVGDKRISWTAFIFGLLMAVARIYLCVHFPSDVLGGLISGIIAGILGTVIAYYLPRKYYEFDIWKPRGGGKHARVQ